MSSAQRAEPAPASPDSPEADVTPLLEALRPLVEKRRTDGRKLALLLIECAVIGRIDGVWGYQVGDAVRERIAAALRTDVLRADDLFGCIGRDDFACVLSTVEDSAVAVLAAEKSLRALGSPFWIGEDEIFACPAIGIAMFPQHGDSAESLLQRAKSACMVAGGMAQRIAEYAEDRQNSEALRLLNENRLRTAVSEDALELVFQPQYDLRLGQIMGAESLLRWRDPALDVIPPVDAFAAAEAAGKVAELVSSLLNRALRNCSEFRYSAGLDLRIAVNLPGCSLRHTEIPDVVERALGTWGLRPGRLVVEVGQTSVLGTDPVARETLGRLKKIGLKLSIDDANLALSSLFWLASLPFQEIKIDVSPAHAPGSAAHSERIMQSIIELARHLKLAVVALGVPDEATATRLKELGCDYMQGDYKGPALDARAFVARFGLDAQ
ncbi:MAG: bifunctional diguanylate cyclase/phosphodiesterase [Betaproteobacteria bacterium]|nr:bifunctional diguanylate cyclase/phosphodiesterase [Betaproteobacteria bacterium]